MLGVLRRFVLPVAENPLGTQSYIMFLLSILSAVTGVVLGVMSWRFKEAKAWLIISALILNIIMVLTGLFLLFSS